MNINMETLLSNFTTESLELLDQAERRVLNFEEKPDSDSVNEIFRAIHTIKGNSGLVDAPEILKLSHSLENVLNQLRENISGMNTNTINVILQSIDTIRVMVSSMDMNPKPEISGLISQLNKISEKNNNQQETKTKSAPVKNGKNGHSKFKVSIPSRFAVLAKEENKFLSYVSMDISGKESEKLSGLNGIFQPLIQRKNILMHGPRIENISFLENVDFKIPFYLVLLTEEEPEKFLLENETVFTGCKIIFAPEKKTEPFQSISQKSETASSGLPNQVAEIQNGNHPPETHLKVPIKLLNRLINLAGETTIARNQLIQKIEMLGDPALQLIGKKIGHLITNLQESVMRTRLQELNSIFSKIPRLVRDVEQSTGKKVDLVIEGGNVELDKTLIDYISDPIMHMIRNSIDHGIESAEERIKKGKKEKGTLTVSAVLRGGNVILTIKDDGKGIDLEKVKKTAIKKGIRSAESLEILNTEEIIELIFLPGFSTSDTVTSTSGRGVGMDVVRTNFKTAGGSVDITSVPDKGTQINAVLPQTLTIITCLMVRSDKRIYGLPQQNIVELILIDHSLVTSLEGRYMYNLRGHLLPLLELRQVIKENRSESLLSNYIAVVRSEKHNYGLLIDEIINPEEIVVNALGEYFSGLNLFSGASILGDGEIVLVLDVPGIARFANLQSNFSAETTAKVIENVSATKSGYLLIDVYGENFAVIAKDVMRIEKISRKQIEHTMDVQTIQFNGELIPVHELSEFFNLKSDTAIDDLFVVIFNINGSKKGLIATELLNVTENIPGIENNTIEGEFILGHAILSGKTTILIDTVAMLSRKISGTKQTLKGVSND